LDAALLEALIGEGNNIIPLDAVPLAEVRTGPALPAFNNAKAWQSTDLRGVFMVGNSVGPSNLLTGPCFLVPSSY